MNFSKRDYCFRCSCGKGDDTTYLDMESEGGGGASGAKADAAVAIDSNNKGSVMLRNMGWAGEGGLGREGGGLAAPLDHVNGLGGRLSRDTIGLGSKRSLLDMAGLEAGDSFKKANLKMARARYDDCEDDHDPGEI